ESWSKHRFTRANGPTRWAFSVRVLAVEAGWSPMASGTIFARCLTKKSDGGRSDAVWHSCSALTRLLHFCKDAKCCDLIGYAACSEAGPEKSPVGRRLTYRCQYVNHQKRRVFRVFVLRISRS